jgi:hypothetical protein
MAGVGRTRPFVLLVAVRFPAALFSQIGKTCSIVPAGAVNRLAVRSPSQVNGRLSTFLAPRRYVLLPISPILVSRLLNYHHPQRDQRLGREPFEAVAPCHRLLQVAVVRRIAELATGYAELFLVAIRMALGQQMVFRKGEPVGKGRGTVEATVAAAVAVAREDFGRVPAKGVGAAPGILEDHRIGVAVKLAPCLTYCPARGRHKHERRSAGTSISSSAAAERSTPASPGM